MVHILHATVASGELLNLAQWELAAHQVEITSTVSQLLPPSLHQLLLPFQLPRPLLPQLLYLRHPQRQYPDHVLLDINNVYRRTRTSLAETDLMDPSGLVSNSAKPDLAAMRARLPTISTVTKSRCYDNKKCR